MVINNLKVFIFSLVLLSTFNQASASNGGYGYTQGLSNSDNYNNDNSARYYNREVAPHRNDRKYYNQEVVPRNNNNLRRNQVVSPVPRFYD